MVGLMEIGPQGSQMAFDVTANLLLGTGGTAGGTAQPMTNIDPLTYQYGEMTVKVHDTSFKTHAAIETKVRIKKAYEIVFSDSTAECKTQKLFNSDFSRYSLVEIKPAWSTGELQAKRLSQTNGVSGLEVRYKNSVWTLYHNRSSVEIKIDLQKKAGGQKSTLHTENESPFPTPSSYNLLPNACILVVSSADPINHENGWENIEQMLKKN
jgi:hypothetical protein